MKNREKIEEAISEVFGRFLNDEFDKADSEYVKEIMQLIEPKAPDHVGTSFPTQFEDFEEDFFGQMKGGNNDK